MKKFYCYKKQTPIVEKTAFISNSAQLIGNVYIGDESSVWFQCVLRGDVNNIKIGKRTNIQDLSMIHLSYEFPTILGDDVTIGHSCILHGCTIESNVLIGMGACILDGAIISKNSIVGAKSLVTKGKTFEEGSLIMGSPAKVVRKLRKEEITGIKESADHYVEYAKEYIKGY